MEPDEKIMHESVISQYRSALADAQFELAQANARGAVKDRIIAELTDQMRPQDAKQTQPKPGPLQT